MVWPLGNAAMPLYKVMSDYCLLSACFTQSVSYRRELAMRHLIRVSALVIVGALSVPLSASACGFFDFACNTAKNKAEKTQAVIAVIDAGRASGWKNVSDQFSSRELAKLRTLGINPSSSGLVNALKDVNDDSFSELDDDAWNGVVSTISSAEYIDKQIAKAKLGVDDLERMEARLRTMQDKAAEAAEAGEVVEFDDSKLLEDIASERTALMAKIGDLDSSVELNVLSGALSSSARTLDAAGVAVARDVMDGGDFDDMVAKAAASAGVSTAQARAVLQQAVSFGVSELSAESLAATDALAESGNDAAALGDYATAYAADASARAQAATARASEAAALQAAGLTAEAAKVAQIAEQESQLAAEAAAFAADQAAETAANAAAAAEIAAQNAAITAAAAAESAAAKASFVAQALADGASQAEAEQLAADAGY